MSLFGKYDVVLAPMAGLTDIYFRDIAKSCGADLTYTEMVSAQGLNYKSKKTFDLLKVGDKENRVAVQLFGHDERVLSEMAKIVEDNLEEKLVLLEVNMGCPARKIVSKGDGCALMKNEALAGHIIESIRRSVSTPVTAKFRRGYYENSETCVSFAKILESAGAHAITVHGRYAEQMYRGKSDNSAIKRVVEAVNIPVVGNGDITCGKDALDMIDSTGVVAIMVARAALSNPFIFEECKAALVGMPYKQRSSIDILNIAIRHVNSFPDTYNFAHFRKHAMYYIKGLKGSVVARNMISTANSAPEFESIFKKLIEVNS